MGLGDNTRMHIGPYLIDPPLVLAPMAGVTDRPFRQLCRQLGAGLAVSEMTTSDATLWHTDKSRLRRDHAGEAGPISVQIAGYDPQQMAEAARFNVEHGALWSVFRFTLDRKMPRISLLGCISVTFREMR